MLVFMGQQRWSRATTDNNKHFTHEHRHCSGVVVAAPPSGHHWHHPLGN